MSDGEKNKQLQAGNQAEKEPTFFPKSIDPLTVWTLCVHFHTDIHRTHTHTQTHTDSYHSPPQGIGIVSKLGGAAAVDCVFLCQVDKVRGEDQAQKANV